MLPELLQGLLISESIMLSHLLDTLTEILSQFTLGNTTTATVFIFQRENLEIVQLAKDAELTKLGDTCDENKANVSLLLLQGAEKISHDVADGLLQLFVTDRIMHRSIIFIDENNNLLTCLSLGSQQDVPKASTKAFTPKFWNFYSIFLLFNFKDIV
ncbi:unknown [Prevotella sp. CAG:732]|nr:unknown [Prevotella sp. CAG:732]